jgi:hypothetical protein
MRTLAMVLALVVAVMPASAQDDPAKQAEKEAEERARKRLDQFKAQIKTCKVEDDFVTAIDTLGDEKHDLIIKELKDWLKHPSMAWARVEAADELGKFKKNEKVAKDLLAQAKRDREPEVSAKCLLEIGKISLRSMAKELVPLYRNKSIKVSQEAVGSAGKLKSKDSIEPLISYLEELEAERERSADQQQSGSVPGGGGFAGPTGGLPGGGQNQNDDEDKKKRLETVLPKVVQSLKDITGEKFSDSKSWAKWWKKNAKSFKEYAEE